MLNDKARGLIALLGRASADDFSLYFGQAKRAFKFSWAFVGGSIYLFLVFAQNLTVLRQRAAAPLERALQSGSAQRSVDPVNFPFQPIGFGFLLYLLGFTGIAFGLCFIFAEREAFYKWATLRHWMVFLALIPLAAFSWLARLGFIPIMAVNFIAFIFYVGWLFADIRLADKFGRLGWMSSVFAACIVHAFGLLITYSLVFQMT